MNIDIKSVQKTSKKNGICLLVTYKERQFIRDNNLSPIKLFRFALKSFGYKEE